MSLNKGLFSSEKMDWNTPKEFFNLLNKRFNFDVDICADEHNALLPNFYDATNSALSNDWHIKYKRAFMNPPYGTKLKHFMKKADEESKFMLVVCLVPSRTDTKWWWDYCMPHKIEFIKGRLKFNDGKNSAPFPSAVVIMGEI